MRTVIIDDDLFFANLLKSKLSKLGFSITHQFESAKSMMNSDFQADVIFVDFHLKNGNCNRLLDFIKTTHPESFVILMSANDYATELCLNNNFLFFLRKSRIKFLPFKIHFLKKIILKRQKKINYLKSLSIVIPVLFAIFLILIF